MRCGKCGADIIGDQSFCTSCGTKVSRGNNTYDLFLPDSTANKRALNLTMEITHKNLEQVTRLLSRPHALILTGLSLNQAAELKSRYLRLGVEADFRRSPDLNKPNGRGSSSQHSFTEDSVWKAENDPAMAKEEAVDRDKKYIIEDPAAAAKLSEESNIADLVRMIFLILTIILFIIGIIFGILYFKKQDEIQTAPPVRAVNQHKNLPLASLPQEQFTDEFGDGLIPASTAAERKEMQQRGKAYSKPTPAEEIKNKSAIEKLLAGQGDADRTEINDQLEQVESVDLQEDLLATIDKAKNRLKNIKAGLDNLKGGTYGDIELVGTHFEGTLNLPDQTGIEITIRQPDNQVTTERQTVSNFAFSSDPLDSILPGNYQVTVRLADLQTQVKELQNRLAAVIKNLDKTQNGKLVERVITVKEAVGRSEIFSAVQVQELVSEMLDKYFGPVDLKNQVLVDEENIVIKGKAADARQFVIQAAAGIGFAAAQSNWQVKNLLVIVNGRKYKIPIKICRESMRMVNNDYKNPQFAENIIKNLQ